MEKGKHRRDRGVKDRWERHWEREVEGEEQRRGRGVKGEAQEREEVEGERERKATNTTPSPELRGTVIPELEGDPHGGHGGVLNQGHTSQTCDQHVLLQGAQVDERTQLPGQVTVMGEGHLLGGVSWEGHRQVTATKYQLKQVVPPRMKERKRKKSLSLS